MYTYICIYVYTYVCVCMHVCDYVCVCVYLYSAWKLYIEDQSWQWVFSLITTLFVESLFFAEPRVPGFQANLANKFVWWRLRNTLSLLRESWDCRQLPHLLSFYFGSGALHTCPHPCVPSALFRDISPASYLLWSVFIDVLLPVSWPYSLKCGYHSGFCGVLSFFSTSLDSEVIFEIGSWFVAQAGLQCITRTGARLSPTNMVSDMKD